MSWPPQTFTWSGEVKTNFRTPTFEGLKMADETHEGAGVYDETTAKWLARIATDRHPSSGEYTLTDGGVYGFSPADEGHQMLIKYHLVGPKVTVMDRHERRRA